MPGTLQLVGGMMLVAVLAIAVLCAVVSVIFNKRKQTPNYFEQMVAQEMTAQGLQAKDLMAPPPKSDSQEAATDGEMADEASEEALEDAVIEHEEPEVAPVLVKATRQNDKKHAANEEEAVAAPVANAAPTDAMLGIVYLAKNDAKKTDVQSTSVASNMDEEDEIVSVAVDTAEESDNSETLLESMTDGDKDYGDFDFAGDFDEWQDEPDEPEDVEEDEDKDIYAELNFDDEDFAFDIADESATVDGGIIGSKYRRSFRSKLIQGSWENKEFYAIIKNELMSYDKARCNESWGGETYMWGKRTYVRIGMVGKTLCVFLALEPKAYADVYNKLRFRDVSNVRKYATTPMLMRIKSDLSLRRTLRLITHIAKAYDLHKKPNYVAEDYMRGLATKDDETLLYLNLIKINPRFVQKIDMASALEAKEAATTRPVMDVTPVKKDQVGNITEQDLDKLEKRQRVDAADKPNASESGKFVIEEEDGKNRFMFYSATGKLLCVSDAYKNRELAIKAVNAYRDIVGKMDALVSMVDGKYFYTLRAPSRTFNSVMYDSQSACLEGLRMARATAPDAAVEYSF
jgi:uncharacterized protein YegP (UPF0339 family)